jgi:hypothetical protein
MYPVYLLCIYEEATERRDLYQIELESGRRESCMECIQQYGNTFSTKINSTIKKNVSISTYYLATDYEHTKAKSLILCSPNSNRNPK